MSIRQTVLLPVAIVLTFAATAAEAQRPVCAPVALDERVQVLCQPFSLFPVVRFLADFTVDQLFKPSPPPFSRSPLEAVQLFAAKEIVENLPLAAFLRGLLPVQFSQLDRTTGTLSAEFATGLREYSDQRTDAGFERTLSIRMPERLQGGYWRGPDVLQLAFWKDHRIWVRVAWQQGTTLEGEVDCLSLSADSLLVRFAPASTNPLLVYLRECPL